MKAIEDCKVHYTIHILQFYNINLRQCLCPCRNAYCTIFQLQFLIVSIRNEQNMSYVFGCGENL